MRYLQRPGRYNREPTAVLGVVAGYQKDFPQVNKVMLDIQIAAPVKIVFKAYRAAHLKFDSNVCA